MVLSSLGDNGMSINSLLSPVCVIVNESDFLKLLGSLLTNLLIVLVSAKSSPGG
jgi:hypothetical protein